MRNETLILGLEDAEVAGFKILLVYDSVKSALYSLS